ncbi:MAG: polysaccharide biosynthesis C-terminal domain-containing protein [Lachnospiraceae bacterium]|nr:polysaccharide biosynthesis C-terminal domain-containing protein [Lachnospiraceae bacterium]
MKDNVFKNSVTSMFVQLAVTAQGLVIPRIIITNFGSNINGLVASLTQFLNFFAIVEGGISGVVLAALYAPLAKKDNRKLSQVIITARGFLKKLGIIFVVYTMVLALIYPIVVNKYSHIFLAGLTVILSATMFMQYYFTLLPQLLIRADDKYYVCNIVQCLFILLNISAAIISVKIFPSIITLKLFSSIVYIIQPYILNKYIEKKYIIDNTVDLDTNLIKERWNGFGISLANLVTTNTDVIVITLFSTLSNVSVYTIYNQILFAVKGITNSISNGYQAQLGLTYAQNDSVKLNIIFSEYRFFVNYIATLFFSSCMELIVSFVMIYTSGVNDANYNQALFALLLCVSQLLICAREPYIQLTYCAGKFKETSKYAYLEASTNILISVFFVYKYGLVGVTIGTIVSILLRLFMTVIYINRRMNIEILCNMITEFIIMAVAVCCSVLVTSFLISLNPENFIQWFITGIKCFGINIICITIVFFPRYHSEIRNMLKKISKLLNGMVKTIAK